MTYVTKLLAKLDFEVMVIIVGTSTNVMKGHIGTGFKKMNRPVFIRTVHFLYNPGSSCVHNAFCYDTDGSFECECETNWILRTNDTECRPDVCPDGYYGQGMYCKQMPDNAECKEKSWNMVSQTVHLDARTELRPSLSG